MKSSSNLNISCKVVFSSNKWNKKVGSPSSFRRKRPFISLNSSASIEKLSRSERARARARANHAKNDAQKGCAMQLNGITLIISKVLWIVTTYSFSLMLFWVGNTYQISFTQRTREASLIHSDKREGLAHPGHYPRLPLVFICMCTALL